MTDKNEQSNNEDDGVTEENTTSTDTEPSGNGPEGDPAESEARKKSVDDEWKEQVQKEKERLKEKTGSQQGAQSRLPEANFSTIIGGIGIQAAISLGQVENPATGETDTDLEQAKHFIDSLKVLKEKTEGNLNQQEENHLDSLLSELQMGYVREAKSRGEGGSDSGNGDDAASSSSDTATGSQGEGIYTP